MYNLDSLSLKYLIEENVEFLKGAVVQKIQMPAKREILLSLRNLGENRKLYINVDPKFAHMNFIEHKENYSIKIPKTPPMFCMLLRKHMEGAKLWDVRTVEYERIVEFYFEIYDEIGSAVPMCLSVEFMGKHSNAILYNASNKIIAGCVHNISPEKSSVREVWGGISYIYPPKQEKTDILKTSIAGFYNVLDNSVCEGSESSDLNGLLTKISNHYYHFSKGLLGFITKKAGADGILKPEVLFSSMQNAVSGDFTLIKEFWAQNISDEGLCLNGKKAEGCSLNSLIEKYFSYFVLKDAVETKKEHLKKLLNKECKKYRDTISNSLKKTSHELNRKKGELILANMYTPELSGGYGERVLLDGVEILLDTAKTLPENAQHYFSLYQKGKVASEVQSEREKKAKENLEYLESILFSIENAALPDVLDEIQEELSEFLTAQKGGAKNSSAKQEKVNVESLEYKGFTIYLGKNNKQNDYLIKKVSAPEDIWLHGKDCPSSHCFIKTENGKKHVTDEVLLYACRLVKENSPMRESAKASIIYTKRKFIKRPPDTHPGYVTYREEKEVVV